MYSRFPISQSSQLCYNFLPQVSHDDALKPDFPPRELKVSHMGKERQSLVLKVNLEGSEGAKFLTISPPLTNLPASTSGYSFLTQVPKKYYIAPRDQLYYE